MGTKQRPQHSEGFSICLPGCSRFFTVALIKILLCAFLQAGHNPNRREHQTLPLPPSHRSRAWAGALPWPGRRLRGPSAFSTSCSQFPTCCPFFAFSCLDSSFPGRDLLILPTARRKAPTSHRRGRHAQQGHPSTYPGHEQRQNWLQRLTAANPSHQ